MSNKTNILHTSFGEIAYEVRRSSYRRTIELSVPSSTSVRILAPGFVSSQTIEDFIRSRCRWVFERFNEKKIEEDRLVTRKYEHGHEFLFLGKSYPLEFNPKGILLTKITFLENRWEVRTSASTTPQIIKSKLVLWYRRQAEEIFGGRVFHYSRLMNLTPHKITVKTQKRLWGSCNPHGRSINLNWILIMAPISVIDYVIVHELCHLEIANHSRSFWRKVGQFMPDYKKSEVWLKENAALMFLPPAN